MIQNTHIGMYTHPKHTRKTRNILFLLKRFRNNIRATQFIDTMVTIF